MGSERFSWARKKTQKQQRKNVNYIFRFYLYCFTFKSWTGIALGIFFQKAVFLKKNTQLLADVNNAIIIPKSYDKTCRELKTDRQLSSEAYNQTQLPFNTAAAVITTLPPPPPPPTTTRGYDLNSKFCIVFTDYYPLQQQFTLRCSTYTQAISLEHCAVLFFPTSYVEAIKRKPRAKGHILLYSAHMIRQNRH